MVGVVEGVTHDEEGCDHRVGDGRVPGVARARHGRDHHVYIFDFDVSVNLPEFAVVDPIIRAGDTIRWVWIADFHNVASCAGQAEEWESDVFQAGDTFVYTFNTPGVYQYYCAPHGFDNFDGTYTGMGGSVTVLPVPGPGGATVLSLAALAAMRRRRSRG